VTTQPRDTPQFFLTAPTRCPYLPGREERKVFTHLVGRHAREMNDTLTKGGFRRSQTIAYRPACDACKGCVSVRIPVDDFKPTRNMRKVLAHNADLVGRISVNRPNSEQYRLFRDYVMSRHGDGGMADMSVLDYSMMIEDTHVETRIVEYRRRGPDTFTTGRGTGPLLGLALTDVLGDGLSMVYSFFDIEEGQRSLGTFMILDHIAQTRKMGLPYLYLGYWVQGSPKMAYKARFMPQERLMPNGWERFDAAMDESA
jgi:arginyl-tRNA--protein-N-Asp/Glu arginylyltransferase